jgi:hypothetical protein
MKLYGFGPTRSLRALWGLKELDADFEFIPVDLLAGEHKRPDFLRLKPAGKVPMADDFGESLDIGRKTRLAGLPGKIHINEPLSLNESPIYQISEHSESHQISRLSRTKQPVTKPLQAELPCSHQRNHVDARS